MPRRVNKKCQACAQLTAEAAIAVHGPTGDNCWNPENIQGWGYDCHRRRSHYRHQADNNAIRRRQRRRGGGDLVGGDPVGSPPVTTDLIVIAAPEIATPVAAVLVLYRQGKDTPVHAIAAEVWRGNQHLASVTAVHCMGMRGDKVTTYLKELLASLQTQFGVSKFEDILKELPVHQCPIADCPLKG